MIFFLFFNLFLKSDFDLVWPPITSNDTGKETYTPYLTLMDISVYLQKEVFPYHLWDVRPIYIKSDAGQCQARRPTRRFPS